MTLKDFRGKEIKIGSTIVYPGRQGSSMWMNEAVVDEFVVVPKMVWKVESLPDGSYNRWEELEDQVFLKVIVKTLKWEWDDLTKTGRHVPHDKKSTIGVLGRVAVVED